MRPNPEKQGPSNPKNQPMRTKSLLTTLAAATALAAATTQAAVININNTSLTPDGTTASQVDQTQINLLNDGGADVLPKVTGEVVYLVTTYTFGTGSDVHFTSRFNATGGQNRLGVEVQDTGFIQFVSSGDTTRTSVNLATDLAGTTTTLLIKQSYDLNNNITYGKAGNDDDNIMNVWVNPTASSVEGSGLSAGDMSTIWNSSVYRFFTQTIANQSTPATAGDSFITNTTILTGADATWANALAIAIPEPSVALLGGLGLLGLLRRRRV